MDLTPYDEALDKVIQTVDLLPTERVILWQALGRVLAEDIKSDSDKPSFDNSAMDGYAVRAEDLQDGCVKLKVIGEVSAGSEPNVKVERGTAVKIFTGAPVPEGADTVIPVEFTKQEEDFVYIEKPLKRGANIRLRGEELRESELILKAGTLIRGYELGLLASVNKVMVSVYQKPKVAVLSTGDEVKDLGETIEKPSQIRSSNNHILYARVMETGCEVVHLGIVKDSVEQIREFLEGVERYDVVLTTGGVSVGEKDYVQKLVEESGFEVIFHKLRVKPAKPVLFAKKGKTLLFGLPGNPVSCVIAFDLLVKPALMKMQGMEDCKPVYYTARLVRDFSRRDAERREFVRARFWEDGGKIYCDYSSKTHSHMLTSYVGANCYMVVYEGVKELKEGQEVKIIPLG
ncbi:MAG: molybdopterin molybdotransferase MoeA [Aquificaceae bacterium]|nr:molybdopterin molybdotransferase MoeA [Aquificaceae bacterium]